MRFLLKLIFILFFLLIHLPAQIPDSFDDIFRSRSSRSYIPDISDGYGVAFRDINNDNLPDIYIIRYYGENHLLLNQGAYRPFKDATALAGLSGNPRPKGVYKAEDGETIYDLKFGTTIIDIENDGDGDVVIAGWGITTALYRNDGNLVFKNITERMDIFPPINANSVVAADIDNDGLTDLVFTDEHYPNRVLLNQDDGFFEDFTEESGIMGNAISRSAAFCDVDNDGDQDLYITNWNQPDDFYLNNGSGRFLKTDANITACENSYQTGSVCFFDLDNDNDFDIVVTRFDGPNLVYLNESTTKLTFSERILEKNSKSYGSIIADFNNDTFADIFFTNIGQNQIHLSPFSDRAYVFTDSQESERTESTGGACADFDLDGDLDLFVSNNNVNSKFYQNHTNNTQYIKFLLHGIKSNRDAIGARITLYKTGFAGDIQHLINTREISGGSGYYSLNDPMVHFGLDTISTVDAIIKFPSGKIRNEYNLAAGTIYEIYEYDLIMRNILLFFQHLVKLMQIPVFWYEVLLALFFLALTFVFLRLGLRRYRWSPGTVSAYLIGFFLLALIAITALNKLGLLTTFVIINILTSVFVSILVINSERYYRLRKIREKYRSVLLDLSNQIVDIHDDKKLFTTVIENVHQNSDFDRIGLYILSEDESGITSFDPAGGPGTRKKITDIPDNMNFLKILRTEKFLKIAENKKLEGAFEYFNSQNIAAIERNERIYGILNLGSTEPVSPLNKEDIDLFKFIGNQMAIAMENNEYIRKSTEMIKKLTAAEVREKYLKELEKTNTELDSKNRDLQQLYDELKSTQSQLIHSEKMASLGQLVAGISHELNNPIGFIYSNAKQLKTYTTRIEKYINKSEDDINQSSGRIQIKELLPDLNGLIQDTISGSQMIKEIVDNLRNFSHLDEAIWKTVDIHAGIESSLKIMLPQFKRQLDIHKDFQASGLISCNPGQLNQVFLNILANAAQAIEDSGNIWINTRDKDSQLLVEIIDDGKGMPQEILDKIFDPFYTTKEVGEGTGLGLSISYSIIQNHQGTISATSTLNKGSTFTIKIPYSDSKPD